jgi:hypothetical protein
MRLFGLFLEGEFLAIRNGKCNTQAPSSNYVQGEELRFGGGSNGTG